MLDVVGHMVVVLCDKTVEAILLTEDGFSDPELTVGAEHLTIEIVSDSATILHIASHVLHSFKRKSGASCGGLVHVLFNVEHGCLKIGVVELVGDTETEGTELTSLLHDRVHETHHEHHGSPLLVGLDLFEEVLVDNGREGTGDTSLKTLWWLSSDLNGHLEETEREIWVLHTGNPETEVFMDLLGLGVENFFHLSHEVKGQVTVVENQPLTITEAGVDNSDFSGLFLFFSHGDLVGWELLLFLCELVNVVGGISTSGKQVKYGLVGFRLLPDFNDLISDGLSEVITKSLLDELVAGKDGSVLTNRSDQTHV